MDHWNPDKYNASKPDRKIVKRLMIEIKSFEEDQLPYIKIWYDENDFTFFHAIIIGPKDTPYQGGFFYFKLMIPYDYPNEPPKVINYTTGNGTVRFNPNLYSDGKVCLSILGTWSGPGWTPMMNLRAVLLSIQSLMNDNPYSNEPVFENVKKTDPRSIDYSEKVKTNTKKAAIEMMLKGESKPQPPKPLQDFMHEWYDSHKDWYDE